VLIALLAVIVVPVAAIGLIIYLGVTREFVACRDDRPAGVVVSEGGGVACGLAGPGVLF
jgi:hypothetical protein